MTFPSLASTILDPTPGIFVRLGWPDYLVILAYLLGMVWIGWFFANREKGSQDFFRGGQRIPFWASGLSLFATGASAVSLMAMPGMAFDRDWTYLTGSFYLLATLLIVLLIYVPLARRLNIATSNEYLERRFGLGFRLFGSLIYSLNQMLARMAAVMLLPAMALEAVVGLPMTLSILVIGIVTTVYSTMGGLEGVVWTDVIQAIGILVAVSLCLVWACAGMGFEMNTAWDILMSEDKLRMFDFSPSLVEPTVIVLFANSLFGSLSMIGDQNFIQRVQCTPSERDSRKAVMVQMLVAVPLNVVLFSLGTVLFLFYMSHPGLLPEGTAPDAIFPVFATQNLPVGLAGVVIAAIFAATMSTLSSALNSTANLMVEDVYRRFARTPPTAASSLRLGRILTFGLGTFGTLAALWLATSEVRSVWDLMIMLTGLILGPITGLFLLGIFQRRVGSAGAFFGIVVSLVSVVCCKLLTSWHPFLLLPVGAITCFCAGVLFSIPFPSPKKIPDNLTIYILRRKNSSAQ